MGQKAFVAGERTARLKFICSDMWQHYLKVIAKKAYSSGIVEGLNRNVNLVTRKAYGYRSYDVLKIALFHTMDTVPSQ